eukprot:jgi/Ulvmu1/11815/UM080_0026.1
MIELGLIYYPGAMVPPKAYIALVQKVQETLRSDSIALHAVIARGLATTYNMFRGLLTPVSYATLSLNGALAALESCTAFKPAASQLFLAGHSMGGKQANTTAVRCRLPASHATPTTPDGPNATPAVCAAVILHASYIAPDILAAFQASTPPIASILGDRDGLIQLSQFAGHRAKEVNAAIPDAAERARRVPLAVLPGVAHISFADNQNTTYVRPRDLAPTLPLPAATASIASSTAAFILMNAFGHSGSSAPSATSAPADATDPAAARAASARAAADFFSQHLADDTKQYLDPFTAAMQQDVDGTTCMEAQDAVLSAPAPSGHGNSSSADIKVQIPTPISDIPRQGLMAMLFGAHDSLAGSTPSAQRQEGAASDGTGDGVGVEVRPCAALRLRGPRTRMSIPAAPLRLTCKLITVRGLRAAIAQAGPEGDSEGSSTEEADGLDAFTCARANAAAVARVLQTLPWHVCELYRTSPLRLCFGADIEIGSAAEWAKAELVFESVSKDDEAPQVLPPSDLPDSMHGGHVEGGSVGMVLRSPRYMADVEKGAGGVLCCAVLSEAQAFEYILYGSQRGPGAGETVGDDDGQGPVLARAAACAVPVVAPQVGAEALATVAG